MDLRVYDANQRMINSFFDESGSELPWISDCEVLSIYWWVQTSHRRMINLLRHSNFQAIVDEYNSNEPQLHEETYEFIPYLLTFSQSKDIEDYIPRQ